MRITLCWRATKGESLPPALEGVDKPTFAHSNKRDLRKSSQSRCGQTGLPTPRATPIFKVRVQEKPVTIPQVLPTPINPASVSTIFREKLFKGFEPPLSIRLRN
jgi:hypothetical protein